MSLYISGDRPKAISDAGRKKPWWMTRYGRWRLIVEREAMGQRFPGFRPWAYEEEGREWIGWAGWLRSALHPENRYLVKVTYPPTFPDDPPDVTIDRPDLPKGTPHLVLGNHPCLFRPTQGPRYGYDPARTTAATLAAWTALWLHAFETWKDTGTWPGAAD